VRAGRPILAAAWAFACGLGYYSFFGQLNSMRLGEPDPAPVPSAWVAVIKGIAVTLAVIALVLTLRSSHEEQG
jgi:hypothetical protein